MSIAFSSSTACDDASSSTSDTFAVTVGGSDDLLVVDIETFTHGNIVSGVTYNGVSMSQNAAGSIIASSNRNTYQYYLASPATGSNNLVISYSTNTTVHATASTYTGANTSSPLDIGNRQLVANASSTATFTLTTTEDDCLMIGSLGENDQTSMSTNTTLIRDSGALVTARTTANVNTGSNSIGWSIGYSTTRYGVVGAYKSAAGGGGVNSNFLAFM